MREELPLDKIIQKQPAALELLYDRHAPGLLSLCLRYMGNLADAEDVMHDGFIKILENLPKFRTGNGCNLEGWMKRIMVNTALNCLRDHSKERRLIVNDPKEFYTSDTEENTEEDVFPDIPDKQVILNMIRDLPPGYRTVFNMYVFEDYSHREIAEELGCSENTSKSQLSKARAVLRQKLSEVLVNERKY